VLNWKYTEDQINSKDSKGNTALFYVARHKNIGFVNYLLDLGANPNIAG